MSKQPKKGGYILQAWLVIFLALLYGGALAGVQIALGPKIAENKKNETYSVIPDLVPGSDKEQTEEVFVTGNKGKETKIYKAISTEGKHQGWVIPASGQGFADKIEVLIGVDQEVNQLTGFYVLDQKETPGLGDYITQPFFRDRFKGIPTSKEIVIVKSDPKADNEVKSLTGATVSSESVSGIINSTLANLKSKIIEKAKQ